MAQSQPARARAAADPRPWSPPPRRRPPPPRPGATGSAQRRRRARHFALRRRDLVEDLAVGGLLAILSLALTAGLGVVALIEVGLVGGLVGAGAIRRWRRRRRHRGRATRSRVPLAGAGSSRDES